MATNKEYRDYILDNLSLLDNITCKPMMGEYLLYYNNLLFGGIYDERLLIKRTITNQKYHLEEAIPYEGAKPMYLIDDVDNREMLRDIILDTCEGLNIDKKKITAKEAEKELAKGKKEAEELLKDPDKLEIFLQKLEKKVKVLPVVGGTFSIVPTMISLVRSYVKKEYTEIPLGTIVGIISALIYILSPIDLIPDPVPTAGYLDDATVLLLCLKVGAKDDIEEYQKWREENKRNIA